MSASSLTVAGVGSRHSTDDAIGLWLVESLGKLPGAVNYVQWENADALTLVHLLLENAGPLLIVDCAEMGLPGGEWRCFAVMPNTDAVLKHHSRNISTHGLGLAEALGIARELGLNTPVHIFGVQPFQLESCLSLNSGLSKPMQAHLPWLLEALQQNIDTLRKRIPQEV